MEHIESSSEKWVRWYTLPLAQQQQLHDWLLQFLSEGKNNLFDIVLSERTRHIVPVIEDIYQEQNSSAVLRTCECLGFQDIYVIEQQHKLKVARRITKGSHKWLDVSRFNESENNALDCIKILKQKGYRIVAMTPHENDSTLEDFDISQKSALVFGSEKFGVSQTTLDHADAFLKIPMVGFTESMNVSVAAAITLSTLRKRLVESTIEWKLTEPELFNKRLDWILKTVPKGRQLVNYLAANHAKH